MVGPHLAIGAVCGGEYKIVRPLAEGGMGAVYVAEQLSTGRSRALKLLHPQMCSDARSRERFAQEARIGARIQSEHVVEVVGAGVDEPTGIPWLAMELLEGTDLAAHVAARGALPPHETIELLEQACDAIGRAHAVGVVHRDLKPENLFIARSTRRGVPFTLKVLDFGISKLIQENHTAATSTSTIGSPLWMAPEQAEHDGKLRPATDVWALGLITFHLLTGRYYWRAANVGETSLTALLKEVLFDPIVPASQRAHELGAGPLPGGFDAWFARCVARDPNARFANATELVEGLRATSAQPGRTAPIAQVHRTMPLPPAPLSVPESAPPARTALWIGIGAALLVGAAATTVGVVVALDGAHDDGEGATATTRSSTISTQHESSSRAAIDRSGAGGAVAEPMMPIEAGGSERPVEVRAVEPRPGVEPPPVEPPRVEPPRVEPPPIEQPAVVAWQWGDGEQVSWNGRWSKPGYQYRFVLSLTRHGGAVEGRFQWTRVDAPGRGTEWVRGTYDANDHRLSLRGYRLEGEVGLDQYRLQLSQDGASMSGSSRTSEGNWSARVSANRASP